MVREVRSAEETAALAEALGRKAKAGSVWSLNGDLGVGKTVFSKGFARGFGVTEEITSPTFAIVHDYQTTNGRFCHFDVYRIEDPDELYEIGMEEYLNDPEAVSLVEWGDMVAEVLPPDVIRVEITKDLTRGTDYRRIEVTGGEDDHFGD